MKTTLRIGVCALAALAPSGLVLGGTLNETVETHTRTVKYSRSSVQTEEGAKALYSKVRAAARFVCGDGAFPLGHDRWAVQSCTAAAVEKAVQQASLPALDAVHKVRKGTIEVIASR